MASADRKTVRWNGLTLKPTTVTHWIWATPERLRLHEMCVPEGVEVARIYVHRKALGEDARPVEVHDYREFLLEKDDRVCVVLKNDTSSDITGHVAWVMEPAPYN